MASYSGQEMTNYTLGRNLNDSFSKNRVVFFNGTRNGSFVSIFDGKYILKHNLITNKYYLFDINSKNPLDEIYDNLKITDRVNKLKELLNANYQATRYLMFNNKKE